MTIKWVKVDPLVMNGEPFCYGSRLTVRQLLELRSNGYGLTELLKDHPELRVVGIAAAFTFAANHPERYAEFLEADGSLAGPGVQTTSRSLLGATVMIGMSASTSASGPCFSSPAGYASAWI